MLSAIQTNGANAAARRRTRRFLAAWLVPTLIASSLLLCNLGGRATLDGHEVLVAQTAREMLRQGAWIVPRFNSQIRLEKPPLAYWLVAATYRLFGRIDAFTARVPSAAAAIATVALVASLATGMYGPRVGMWAGLVHLTTYWTIAYGKSAVVDGLLALLVAAAIVLATIDRRPISPLQWSAAILGFWTLCGAAVLAKGPVGLVIIGLTVTGHRALRRRRFCHQRLLLHWASIPGVMVFFSLACVWPFVVLVHEPTATNLWLGQTVGRYLEHWGPNTRSWCYYLYQAPALTLPWSPLWICGLIVGLGRALRRLRADRDNRAQLLWIWLLGGLLFFTMSLGKREHYVLPCLLPASVLAAKALVRWQQASRNRTRASAFAIAVAAAAVFLSESWLVPQFCWRGGTLELFARNRQILREAEHVIQLGSGDRWTAFPLDRTMHWSRSLENAESGAVQNPNTLLLVTESYWPVIEQRLNVAVLDRVVPQCRAETNPNVRLLLARSVAGRKVERPPQSEWPSTSRRQDVSFAF